MYLGKQKSLMTSEETVLICSMEMNKLGSGFFLSEYVFYVFHRFLKV